MSFFISWNLNIRSFPLNNRCNKSFHFVNARRQYLSNAVLQAKNASDSGGLVGSTRGAGALDSGLLDLLEGKLVVLRFQIKIKEELEAIASVLQSSSSMSEPIQDGSVADNNANVEYAKVAQEKANELSLDLKSITQLYNEYAVPFELWEVHLSLAFSFFFYQTIEFLFRVLRGNWFMSFCSPPPTFQVCLEMLYFANYSGDADSSIVRETWARLMDKALSSGGIAEACSVLKRVGSHIYPGDGAVLPLDTLCLHLEKAALVKFNSIRIYVLCYQLNLWDCCTIYSVLPELLKYFYFIVAGETGVRG